MRSTSHRLRPQAKDSRSAHWTGQTCQLEALAPDLLAEIVNENIRSCLDMDILAGEIATEKSDQIEIGYALPPGVIGLDEFDDDEDEDED